MNRLDRLSFAKIPSKFGVTFSGCGMDRVVELFQKLGDIPLIGLYIVG